MFSITPVTVFSVICIGSQLNTLDLDLLVAGSNEKPIKRNEYLFYKLLGCPKYLLELILPII